MPKVNESLKRIREQFLNDCRSLAPDLVCEISQGIDLDTKIEDGSAPDLDRQNYEFSFDIMTIVKGEFRRFSDSITGVSLLPDADIGDVNHYLWSLAMGACDELMSDWMVRTFNPSLVEQAEAIHHEAKMIQDVLV